MDKLEQLKSLSVLKNLKPAELENLSKTVYINEYSKGQYVYKCGVKMKFVYLILDGNVKLGADNNVENSIVKEVIANGDIFGENVFVDKKRSDYAITTTKSRMLLIPVNEFRALVMSNPQFYQTIMKIIVEKLFALEERMKSFVFEKAKSRIKGFLKRMGEQKGHLIGFEEILLRLNMSHKEIGLLTDTSRQTVARIFSELKRDNIIHFTPRKPGRILIRNMNALSA